jgi:hypothetical protein
MVVVKYVFSIVQYYACQLVIVSFGGNSVKLRFVISLI